MTDFIRTYVLEDQTVCDEILEYFFKNKDQATPGGFLKDANLDAVHDPEVKDCTEIALTFNKPEDVPILNRYFDELDKCLAEYCKEFEWAANCNPFQCIEPVSVQRYLPGQGYKAWHCERGSPTYPFSARHLVFMTYLNDVFDEGGTEWIYQNLKTKARKAHTVIWPADWTHTHRGIVSPTQEKWIITGWFNYVRLNPETGETLLEPINRDA